MKTAVYHNEDGTAQEFAVLADHKDGTFDVGHEGGDVVVSKVLLSEDGAPGTITNPAAKAKPAEEAKK